MLGLILVRFWHVFGSGSLSLNPVCCNMDGQCVCMDSAHKVMQNSADTLGFSRCNVSGNSKVCI